MIRAGVGIVRRELAKRKLQRMVDQRRNSFEVIDYSKRRAAAKLGIERRSVG